MQVDIKTVRTWSMSAQVADKFQVCCHTTLQYQDILDLAQASLQMFLKGITPHPSPAPVPSPPTAAVHHNVPPPSPAQSCSP